MHRILGIGHLKNYCHSDFGLLLQFKHVYVEKGSKRGGVQPLEKSKKNKNLEKQEICKHEICSERTCLETISLVLIRKSTCDLKRHWLSGCSIVYTINGKNYLTT